MLLGLNLNLQKPGSLNASVLRRALGALGALAWLERLQTKKGGTRTSDVQRVHWSHKEMVEKLLRLVEPDAPSVSVCVFLLHSTIWTPLPPQGGQRSRFSVFGGV